MAEGRNIPLILNVDGVKAIKTVGELKKGIADTRKELEKTEVGSKRFDELSESVKKAESRLGELNKKATAFKDFPGPIGALAKTFDDVKMATGRVIASMTTLRGAFIATGIGALVAAFGALMAYFKGTEEGAQRLRVIMAVLGGVTDQLKDVAIAVGKALFDAFASPKETIIAIGDAIRQNIVNRIEGMMELFPALGRAINLAFEGEFAEAGKVATNAIAKTTLGVTDFTDKVTDAAKATADWGKSVVVAATEAGTLADALNKVLVRERELKVERAETNKIIAEQRNRAKDLNLTLDERIAALSKANEMEVDLMTRELANEQERLRIMEAQKELSSTPEETLNAIAEQRVKVAQIEEQSLNKRRELIEQVTTLRNMEAAEEKRLADEKAARDKEMADKELALQRELRDARIATIQEDELRETEEALAKFEDRLARIREEYGAETELIGLLETEREQVLADIRAKFEEKRKADKEKADAELLKSEQALAAARVSVANSVASGLASVSQMIQGESEAAVIARKVLAGAQIAIDTATAIAGAISAGSSLPFPANIAGIATGVATVLANVAQATQLLSSAPVGGGASVSTPSAPVSAPQIAPVTTNTSVIGDTQQIELSPVQAYVVETDITGNQQNIDQIQSQANFG